MIRRLVRALVASVMAASQQPAGRPPRRRPRPDSRRVNADALTSVQFLKRIEDYVALHKKLEATLPARPEHATPQQVDAHARALSKLLVEARPRAKQGDMLPSDDPGLPPPPDRPRPRRSGRRRPSASRSWKTIPAR